MKVLFDHQIFWLQRQGGISRYFCELALALQDMHDCTPEIIAPFHVNSHLEDLRNPLIHKRIPNLKRRFYYNRWWDHRIQKNLSSLKTALKSGSILHETYYTHRIETKTKKITTVHDMIHEKFPGAGQGTKDVIRAKRGALSDADAIIAVSEHTKKDLITFYPEVAAKVHVIYHGVRRPVLLEKRTTTSRPFILYVGNRGLYKNFEELLDVFLSERSINEAFDLVCFGGEMTEESLSIIRSQTLRDRVILVRGDDQLLWQLYHQARVLVYNSKYEGFGMPILEAMVAGCPVVCSDTSSLPEVGGEAVLYVSPGKPEQLLNVLEQVLYNDQLRNELIHKGKVRSEKFSWKKCATETFKVYNEVWRM